MPLFNGTTSGYVQFSDARAVQAVEAMSPIPDTDRQETPEWLPFPP